MKDWANNPQLRAQLSAALADPTLQLALQTASRLATPTVANPPGEVTEAMMTSLSLKYMHRAGFAAFPSFLANLVTVEPSAMQTPALSPFGELKPEPTE